MKILPIFLIAIALAFIAGCGLSTRLPIGEKVVVQFDRSALGGGGSLPINPTTFSINGASVVLEGKLLDVSEDWICIESIESAGNLTRKYWIARSKVLLLQKADF